MASSITPKLLLGALVIMLVSLAAVGGIAFAVVEWRTDSTELDPVEQRLTRLEAAVSELTEGQDTLQSSLEALALQFTPPPAPEESAPPPTAKVRLAVNWVQRAIEFSPIGSSKPWVVVNVTIENLSEAGVDVFYAGSQFTAKDDADFVYPAVFPTGPFSCGPISEGREKILEPPLLQGSLAPGEKTRGDMAFDMPEGTTLTKLVWSGGVPALAEVVDLPQPQVSVSC